MSLSELPLDQILRGFNKSTPKEWLSSGTVSRHDLHGFIRYPAMMVPTMQADILQAIVNRIEKRVHVIDPFVGSGTVMTEAMRRNLSFTGVDINPLAILTCEAKVAVEAGAPLDTAAIEVLEALKRDWSEKVDVSFPKIEKWFTLEQTIEFSRFRRAIMAIEDRKVRQCFWVAFAETIRCCSNSRTSTYKLHKRPDSDVVSASVVRRTFENNIHNLLNRTADYRKERGIRFQRVSLPELICGDIQNVSFEHRGDHCIVMTSPPYGDNRTTIPYGQFSYLALNWIPRDDLPTIPDENWLANAAAIDTASLGGSLQNADTKMRRVMRLSPHMRDFFDIAGDAGRLKDVRKVGAFLWDYYLALKTVRKQTRGKSHWVITSGNRTTAGLTVPFDKVCEEFVERLGGTLIETVHRRLPVKRMPNRNSNGVMITSETTLVASFD
ncbi:MAG TPA: hypothetical protein DCS30_02805 [Rhizobiales bacterium]|nr:hypothetical protein [Hyphomicrobiales bacterium]